MVVSEAYRGLKNKSQITVQVNKLESFRSYYRVSVPLIY